MSLTQRDWLWRYIIYNLDLNSNVLSATASLVLASRRKPITFSNSASRGWWAFRTSIVSNMHPASSWSPENLFGRCVLNGLHGNPHTNRSSGSGLKEHTCPWRRQWALFFATSAANLLAMFHPKGEGSNLSGRFFFFSSRCKTNTTPKFVTNGFPQNESKWWVLKKKNSGFKHGVILGIHSSKFQEKIHVFLWKHIPIYYEWSRNSFVFGAKLSN